MITLDAINKITGEELFVHIDEHKFSATLGDYETITLPFTAKLSIQNSTVLTVEQPRDPSGIPPSTSQPTDQPTAKNKSYNKK